MPGGGSGHGRRIRDWSWRDKVKTHRTQVLRGATGWALRSLGFLVLGAVTPKQLADESTVDAHSLVARVLDGPGGNSWRYV